MSRMPSQRVLKALLNYDPLTGILTWKPRAAWMFRVGKFGRDGHALRWNTKHAHKPALMALNNKGYLHGSILGQNVSAHRVIWKILHNQEPIQIDHENGLPADNREKNLSAACPTTNNRNSSMSRRNSSGVCGISFCKRRGMWRAYVGYKGLGYFHDKELAIRARKDAANKLGYSPRHGLP